MRICVLMLSVLLSLWLEPGAGQTADSHSHRASEAVGRSAGAFGQLMSAAMDKMHREMAAAPQTGDADRDFLALMIPHHAGAVEMARLLLVYGKDPLVRQLAEEIISGQQAEIGAMQSRLGVLQKGADPQPGGFPALTGTRGE